MTKVMIRKKYGLFKCMGLSKYDKHYVSDANIVQNALYSLTPVNQQGIYVLYNHELFPSSTYHSLEQIIQNIFMIGQP